MDQAKVEKNILSKNIKKQKSTDKSKKVKQKKKKQKMQGSTRLASHANSWYTGNQKELDQELSGYLSKANKQQLNIQKVKALIGPHAGYYYSGPTAAWGYQYLQPIENLRVFLLGPCHHIYMNGCGISGLEKFQTPLGDITLDKQTIQELKNTGKFDVVSKKNEEDEHSLEMHLPYIQKILGQQQFKLVPIMVGNLSYQREQEYGQLLSKYFDDDNTVFIISSDFCHWGSRFDYQYYNKQDGEIWQSIQKLDTAGMELIENHDCEKFNKYLEQTENTICGRHPIGVLLQVIKSTQKYAGQLKTKFMHYEQSEQVKTQKSSSVSYATSITYV
ncbi:AmmeMemoRadiSam system protein B (macronuclear) [Tetrahymena thermophila SB210]|uniref:AmmeMemoRadiSam system protein B n=1 Tax=Tetrahymena thermophila (strain SB210) TaxID=312017 RepID=I7MKM3_TETTS|nr:AmmeMemoRadiSam system protein B [Tetrahymena thermophila SB210]EAR99554.4 AmmeMemoRadiSam system protein B [Tetrahymena thermophila SB210]|eukprot:XP_001019799.4 AmmeMemoRadiSam system protein B [Tetrahymena thermophila SB210]